MVSSIIGAPSLLATHPGKSVASTLAANLNLLPATAEVAASNNIGASILEGDAIEIGFDYFVKNKLKELGFYGQQALKKEEKKKEPEEKKKKKPKKKTNEDIVKKLKDLNELYESGVLTKEEFEKAKNKLLD